MLKRMKHKSYFAEGSLEMDGMGRVGEGWVGDKMQNKFLIFYYFMNSAIFTLSKPLKLG